MERVGGWRRRGLHTGGEGREPDVFKDKPDAAIMKKRRKRRKKEKNISEKKKQRTTDHCNN